MTRQPKTRPKTPKVSERVRRLDALTSLDRRMSDLTVTGRLWTASTSGATVEARCAGATARIELAPGVDRWRLDLTLPRGTALTDGVTVICRVDDREERGQWTLREARDVTPSALTIALIEAAPLQQTITVGGWWTDRPSGSEIRLLVNGQPAGNALTGLHRPDVARATLLGRSDLGWKALLALDATTDETLVITAQLKSGGAVVAERHLSLTRAEVSVPPVVLRRYRAGIAAIKQLSAGGLRRRLASWGFFNLVGSDNSGLAQALRAEIAREIAARRSELGPLRIRLFNGDLVDVDPARDTVMARKILFEGGYEIGFLEWVEAVLAPGDTMIDVGSAYGLVSLSAARAVQVRGCVIAIDANPECASATRRHAALNGHANIHVIESAISDRVGHGTLAIDAKGNIGASTLKPDARLESREAFADQMSALAFVDLDNRQAHAVQSSDQVMMREVRTTTLDQICIDQALRDVCLVKVDTEGAELLALRGAERLIRGDFGAPPVLVLEYSTLLPTIGGTLRDLYDLLRQRGWSIFVMGFGKSRGGGLRRINRFEDMPVHDNIFCYPPGRQPLA
jgi:FkbM family methyltransferase